jgi:hypothetical protein
MQFRTFDYEPKVVLARLLDQQEVKVVIKIDAATHWHIIYFSLTFSLFLVGSHHHIDIGNGGIAPTHPADPHHLVVLKLLDWAISKIERDYLFIFSVRNLDVGDRATLYLVQNHRDVLQVGGLRR